MILPFNLLQEYIFFFNRNLFLKELLLSSFKRIDSIDYDLKLYSQLRIDKNLVLSGKCCLLQNTVLLSSLAQTSSISQNKALVFHLRQLLMIRVSPTFIILSSLLPSIFEPL